MWARFNESVTVMAMLYPLKRMPSQCKHHGQSSVTGLCLAIWISSKGKLELLDADLILFMVADDSGQANRYCHYWESGHLPGPTAETL